MELIFLIRRLWKQTLFSMAFAQGVAGPVLGAPLQVEEVSKVLVESLRILCAADVTPEKVMGHFAPDGARKAEMTLLTTDKPYYIQNNVMTSLRLFRPFDFVVWWAHPKDSVVTEYHLVLDSSVRIVPYEQFVSQAGLGASQSRAQTHPLGDIVHQHRLPCEKDRQVKVAVHQIVWAGDFVGKVGEFTVYR